MAGVVFLKLRHLLSSISASRYYRFIKIKENNDNPYRYGKGIAVCGHIVKAYRGMEIFTFFLPCIVMDSFLNDKPDALIIQFFLLLNSTCFGHLLCPSSGVLYCTFGTGKFHAHF
jgi:hypothetical protein